MELMTVIAIVAVMSAIVVPNLLSHRPDAKLKGAARELAGDIQSTRLAAIRANEPCRIVFDAANNDYEIWDSQGDADADGDAFNDGDEIKRKEILFSGYKAGIIYGKGNAATEVTGGTFTGNSSDFISYSSPDNTLTFNSMGTCNAGYVYLSNTKGSAYAVGTLSSGIVILKRWNGTGWE